MKTERIYFDAYFEGLAKGKGGVWLSALACLKKFGRFGVDVGKVTPGLIESFKSYLSRSVTKSNVLLSASTQAIYFSKIKESFERAVREGLVRSNPCEGVVIRSSSARREYLSLEELNRMVVTPCRNKVLKRAFLFSCLTGMRYSDTAALRWDNIEHSPGYCVRFTQKKTGTVQTIPISVQALKLLGNRPENEPCGLIFKLVYNSWSNKLLQQWVSAAGITKAITFHCGRHTFATLQLSAGTDITTISNMLGHRSLNSTMIYSAIVDSSKVEASNKIKLDL